MKNGIKRIIAGGLIAACAIGGAACSPPPSGDRATTRHATTTKSCGLFRSVQVDGRAGERYLYEGIFQTYPTGYRLEWRATVSYPMAKWATVADWSNPSDPSWLYIHRDCLNVWGPLI